MGEMIKFGIKMALTIATAVALCAALLILFNLIASSIPASNASGFGTLKEMFWLFGLIFPVNLVIVFSSIGSLFAFKVAYWAADKMLWLIDVLG